MKVFFSQKCKFNRNVLCFLIGGILWELCGMMGIKSLFDKLPIREPEMVYCENSTPSTFDAF
jgi:hypothetical protein